MINRKLFALSLMITIVSGQSEKTEASERSSQPQAEGRFFSPFGGFGRFRPGGFLGGGLYPGPFARPGGYPGFFGGYYPGAFRPGGFGGYPGGYYGGYPQYPRPGVANRPYGGFGGAAGGVPSVTRPGSDNTNNNRPSTLPNLTNNNRPNALPNLSNLTPSQAALLGQALGASLRPLLMANGGAGLGSGGLSGAGSANTLADILAQLG